MYLWRFQRIEVYKDGFGSLQSKIRSSFCNFTGTTPKHAPNVLEKISRHIWNFWQACVLSLYVHSPRLHAGTSFISDLGKSGKNLLA